MRQSERIVVTTHLTTLGPLAIHTGSADEATDQPVLTDARGLPWIPGSSLAGAMRSASCRIHPDDHVVALWGSEKGDDAMQPSAIRVFDAGYMGGPVPAEFRHHVGIDRATGAARKGIKFDEEVWPRRLEFLVAFELPKARLDDLKDILVELASPRGGVGSGACPVAVGNLEWSALPTLDEAVASATTPVDPRAAALPLIHHGVRDRTTVEMPSGSDAGTSDQTAGSGDSDAALTADDSTDEPAPADADAEVDWVRLRITLELVEELRTAVPVDASDPGNHDILPFTVTRHVEEAVPNAATPHEFIESTVALAGTSLQGVLRTRSEYWAAARGNSPPDAWSVGSEDRHHPVISAWGWASIDRNTPGAASRIRVSDFVNEDGWAAVPADMLPEVLTRQRVAMDRLTGATYGSSKFEDTVVRDGTCLSGTIDLAPPDGGPVRAADLTVAVVGLADLHDGLVGVGGGSRSGYGTVHIRDITWEWQSGDDHHTEATDWPKLPQGLVDQLGAPAMGHFDLDDQRQDAA